MTQGNEEADDDGIDSVHFERCADCGTPLETDEWQPVEVVRVHGTIRLLAFCDEECHEAFLDSE